MQDIRKQFSLDWLSGRGGSDAQTKSLGQSSLDEAVVLYGQPILRSLEKEKDGRIGLHDLARGIKDDIPDFKFSELWEVIEHMARLSMVEIVDSSDATGNYIIGLGKKARSKA